MPSNAIKSLGMLMAVVGAGYTVAMFGNHNSVGESIPDARQEMRTQGAQGQAVKSGMDVKKAANEIKDVETRGGDRGTEMDQDAAGK